MDISIAIACDDAQTLFDGLSCVGVNATSAQEIMNEAFFGSEGACLDLHLCGATMRLPIMGGESLKTLIIEYITFED